MIIDQNDVKTPICENSNSDHQEYSTINLLSVDRDYFFTNLSSFDNNCDENFVMIPPWLGRRFPSTVNNPNYLQIGEGSMLGVGNARSLAKIFHIVGLSSIFL